MWHVALESWQWIHQVAQPCSVIRGSGMTCRWIHPVAAPCNVAGGSRMTWHGIRPNVRHIRILHLVSIFIISPESTSFCTSLRNFNQIGPPSAEKMTSCRFSRWRISAILNFTDPLMGSLKRPCKQQSKWIYIRRTFRQMSQCADSSIDTTALNCLVFEKIALLHFGVKIQDGASPPSWILGFQ